MPVWRSTYDSSQIHHPFFALFSIVNLLSFLEIGWATTPHSLKSENMTDRVWAYFHYSCKQPLARVLWSTVEKCFHNARGAVHTHTEKTTHTERRRWRSWIKIFTSRSSLVHVVFVCYHVRGERGSLVDMDLKGSCVVVVVVVVVVVADVEHLVICVHGSSGSP